MILSNCTRSRRPSADYETGGGHQRRFGAWRAAAGRAGPHSPAVPIASDWRCAGCGSRAPGGGSVRGAAVPAGREAQRRLPAPQRRVESRRTSFVDKHPGRGVSGPGAGYERVEGGRLVMGSEYRWLCN